MSINSQFFNETYKDYILNLGKEINSPGFICQKGENIPPEFLKFTPGINIEIAADGSQNYNNPINLISDFYIVGRGILAKMGIYNKLCSTVLYKNACFNKKQINLCCSLAPNVNITPFWYNAAGVHCTTYKELLELDYSCSGAVLSKTCTLSKLAGNEHPRYYLDKEISINSTGLANEGIGAYSSYNFVKPYIISVATKGLSDFKECILKIYSTNVSAIEVNISCPNIEDFTDEALMNFEKYLLIMEEFAQVPWGLKMQPFFSNKEIDKYVAIIKKYSVSFIVCANSFSNGLVLKNQEKVIVPRNGLGGIGGCYGFKAIALSNAREFANKLPNTTIIGCGGIRNIDDIKDYLSVGCSGVQIGSELDRVGLALFKDILDNYI
jgi:dihydroorotate dehydrogenase (fumarate)